MIGLVGSYHSGQVQRVRSRLIELGHDVIVLDQLLSPKLQVELGERTELRLDGIDLAACSLLWWRPIHDYPKFGGGPEFRDQYVTGISWEVGLANLWSLLGDRALNTQTSSFRMRFKLAQLELARSVGFAVPPTCLSNSHDELLSWARRYESLVVKPSGSFRIPAANGQAQGASVMTHRTCVDEVSEHRRSIEAAPALFQREIPKAHELRVIACGEEILAFRIDSQAFESTKVDWRYGNQFLKFERCDLPMSLRRQIASFMRKAGLFEGHFDFVVDKSGQIYFIECNTEGMWGWLDDLSDFAVSGAIAQELSKAVDRRGHKGRALSRNQVWALDAKGA